MPLTTARRRSIINVAGLLVAIKSFKRNNRKIIFKSNKNLVKKFIYYFFFLEGGSNCPWVNFPGEHFSGGGAIFRGAIFLGAYFQGVIFSWAFFGGGAFFPWAFFRTLLGTYSPFWSPFRRGGRLYKDDAGMFRRVVCTFRCYLYFQLYASAPNLKLVAETSHVNSFVSFILLKHN